jgi:hypothetical protein
MQPLYRSAPFDGRPTRVGNLIHRQQVLTRTPDPLITNQAHYQADQRRGLGWLGPAFLGAVRITPNCPWKTADLRRDLHVQ